MRPPGFSPWQVKLDGQDSRVRRKVAVRGQDRHRASGGGGADQEIDGRTLDPSRTTSVEKRCGLLVVLCGQGNVGKCAKMRPQRLKLFSTANARKQFLPDKSQDRCATLTDQLTEFDDTRMRRWAGSAQGQGPYRGVD